MASKYASIVKLLQTMPASDVRYQELIDAVKGKILSATDPVEPESLAILAEESMEDVHLAVGTLHAAFLDAAAQRHHASVFARCYASLRDLEERFENHLKEIRLLLKAYEQLTINYYEIEGTTSLKLASGGTVRLQHEPHARVIDSEKFRQWCIANGFEHSLQLPWQSINAITKERLLLGNPEPDGVQAYVNTKLVRTR